MKKTILSLALCAPLMAGCVTGGMGTKQGFGTLGGAAGGALLGSQIGGGTGKLIALGAGTLLGAFLGSEIGASLDRADEAYVQRAVQRVGTASTGRTIRWENPETGNRGTFRPTNLPRRTRDGFCREFSTTIFVDGQAQKGTGRACQNRDGTWAIN